MKGRLAAVWATLCIFSGCLSGRRVALSHPVFGIICGRARSMDSLMHAWARGFHQEHPGVKVTLKTDTKWSAGAFEELLAGKVQIAPFARELFLSEKVRFKKRFGYPPTLIPVAGGSYATSGATHAITIYVNAANPLKRISLPQLGSVFGAGRTITRWGQLGLTGRWQSRHQRVVPGLPGPRRRWQPTRIR